MSENPATGPPQAKKRAASAFQAIEATLINQTANWSALLTHAL